MNSGKIGILTVALVLSSLACVGGSIVAAETEKTAAAGAGKESTVTEHHKATRGLEKDPNIKSNSMVNNAKKTVAAPVDKGGPKTRGVTCRLHIDNRTPWIIQIYADGDFLGTVSKYGDSWGTEPGQTTTLYARADFTDGTSFTWGPKVVNLGDWGTYTWRLWD